MATSVQALPLTRGPSKNYSHPFPPPPLSPHCGMGSVGSLVERPDVSPTKGSRAVPQVRPKPTNGLLKKGLTQRELLNYLNITRRVQNCRETDACLQSGFFSICCSANRKETKGSGAKKDLIGDRDEDNFYAKVYDKNGAEVDLTKNSLPSGGKYEKVKTSCLLSKKTGLYLYYGMALKRLFNLKHWVSFRLWN